MIKIIFFNNLLRTKSIIEAVQSKLFQIKTYQTSLTIFSEDRSHQALKSVTILKFLNYLNLPIQMFSFHNILKNLRHTATQLLTILTSRP